MKFAFVFYLKDSFGGAERRITRIYNELCKDNTHIKCDVVVRGCNKQNALALFRQADCDISNFGDLIAFENNTDCLKYIFMTKEYCLVQFFSASRFNYCLQLACKLTMKKSLYTICGYQEACNSFPDSHMKWVRRQLKFADYVDLLNPTGMDFVSQHIKKGKLLITPGTFTDLQIFQSGKKEKIMLYAAARLEDSKNPKLLVHAIELCQEELRKCSYQVIVLGKGEHEEYLKRFLKEKHIDDIVKMVGYDKTSKYLPQAEVFFSLQELENYPSQSLAEAIACGCYVIITDVGDSRKCADESFAKFVDADIRQLADAVIDYLAKSDLEKKSFVNYARRFAESNYDIEKSKEYFKGILEEVK